MDTIRRAGLRSGMIAVVALVPLIVAACGGAGNATPPVIYITPAPPTLAPGATPTPEPPGPSITNTLISTSAPDGKWTVLFKKPAVSGSGDAISKVNDAISAKVSGYIDTFTKGDLPAVASGASPSSLDGNYTVAMDTGSIVSLRFTILATLSGAAHSTVNAGGMSFSLSTGAQLTFDDIFSNTGDAAKVLADKTQSALSASLGSDLKWPGNATDITFYENAWVVTPAGLEITWNEGQIASDAAGTPSVVISWSDLKSVLKSDSPVAGLAG